MVVVQDASGRPALPRSLSQAISTPTAERGTPMVIERLVWRARFGQGDQIADAFRAWRGSIASRYNLTARILVDLTGSMFTVVVETEYRDMVHVAEMTQQ